MDKEEMVMIVLNDKCESIFIGKIAEIPQWLMANYKPIGIGYESAAEIKLIYVKRRDQK